MNEKIERIKIERTKRNLPALWEHGGGWTNTGSSFIIAGCDGEMPTATYVRKKGHLAGGDHALIIIKPGMLLIRASHHNSEFHISIMRIEAINDDYADIKVLNEFSQGEWDLPPDPKHQEAIKAAMKKAQCYHCGGPHYALVPEKQLPI